jgi:hypothetical protein
MSADTLVTKVVTFTTGENGGSPRVTFIEVSNEVPPEVVADICHKALGRRWPTALQYGRLVVTGVSTALQREPIVLDSLKHSWLLSSRIIKVDLKHVTPVPSRYTSELT